MFNHKLNKEDREKLDKVYKALFTEQLLINTWWSFSEREENNLKTLVKRHEDLKRDFNLLLNHLQLKISDTPEKREVKDRKESNLGELAGVDIFGSVLGTGCGKPLKFDSDKDTRAEIDKSSPEYKKGYANGYAAGKRKSKK